MGQNEAGVTEIFREILREGGARFAPTGGQDRQVLADELVARSGYFSLVEMKYSKAQFRDETDKLDRVRLLCNALASDEAFRQLHDACHFIAGRSGDQIAIYPYRDQVCNDSILGTPCSLTPGGATYTGQSFSKAFFKNPPKACISTDQFQLYLTQLLKVVSANDPKELILLARGADGFSVVEVKDLAELQRIFWPSKKPKTMSKSGRSG